MDEKPRPILKWAGGKRSIAASIIGKLPNSFHAYIEPFLGGGSIFFSICESLGSHRAILADINEDLMCLYEAIKEKPGDLVREIHGIQYKNSREDFYMARAEYNSLPACSIRRSALLVYLNRHCYNGLYRVNRNGMYNVPFGRYANPSMPGEDSIRAASRCLSGARLIRSDFFHVISLAGSGDLIYADPPYTPVSKSSNFTSYSKGGFGWEDQIRLKKALELADRNGAYFILSNSWVREILDLYSSYSITRVEVNRNINSVPDSRGKIPEAIIRNF